MQSDGDGTRHTLLLFPAGTTASLVFADGRTEPATPLHVRATEFTVGARGPDAMPAVLPPLSGYTYCTELSADEAIAAGADSVAFNQPVILYAENFLAFRSGRVPLGIAGRPCGSRSQRPGREILAVNGGVATSTPTAMLSPIAGLDHDGGTAGARAMYAAGTSSAHAGRSLHAAGRQPLRHDWRHRRGATGLADGDHPIRTCRAGQHRQ
jgi:hypothetical protein